MNIRKIVITGAAALALTAGGAAAGQVPAARASSASRTATPRVKLSARTGPPTSTVKVSGTGLGANRAVDIYFDTTDEALASTNGNGVFAGIAIRVPASAVPGTHHITAVQRHAGRSAQARFLVNTNWAQFHYSPTRSGFNPYENVLSRSNVAGLGVDWTFPIGPFDNSSPAVANGVVYMGDLAAVSAATGAELWSARTDTSESSPAVANGAVYVGGADGMFAFNATTGATLWKFFNGIEIDSSPAVANGVVYVGVGNVLYAFNAATGATLWTFTTKFGTDSSSAVANGVVCFTSTDGKMYALNAATGAKLWSFATTGAGDSSPALVNGVVYFGSGIPGTTVGHVWAFEAATGIELWNFTTGNGSNDGSVGSTPTVANGVVYVPDAGGTVYALSAFTGAKLWSFDHRLSVRGSAIVANGVVYISGNDDIFALSAATGAQLWSFNTGGPVGSSPAVANGMVYVGSSDGNLYAFHLPGGVPVVNRPAAGQLHPNYALRPQEGSRT